MEDIAICDSCDSGLQKKGSVCFSCSAYMAVTSIFIPCDIRPLYARYGEDLSDEPLLVNFSPYTNLMDIITMSSRPTYVKRYYCIKGVKKLIPVPDKTESRYIPASGTLFTRDLSFALGKLSDDMFVEAHYIGRSIDPIRGRTNLVRILNSMFENLCDYDVPSRGYYVKYILNNDRELRQCLDITEQFSDSCEDFSERTLERLRQVLESLRLIEFMVPHPSYENYVLRKYENYLA
jgi:hypothetical protein